MAIQTATNPETGERRAYINGEWQPIEQSATNPQGLKAYKIGGAWHVDDTPAAPAPSEIPAARKPLTSAQEAYQAARPYFAPVVETGGAILGGIQGAAAGALGSPTVLINPVTGAVAGSGLGYGIAKSGLNLLDEYMGLRKPPESLTAAGREALGNVAEGATYEMGGQILGPVVSRGIVSPTVNYLRRVSDPKAAALADAAQGKAPEIINALRNYDQYVAQGMPIAGVAAAPAGSTGYAALQTEVMPHLRDAYYARAKGNVAARREALGGIAQDEAALAAAEKARAEVVKPLYGAADKQIIKADDTLNTLLERPSMEKALARAGQLAKERGEQLQIGKSIPEQKVGSTIVDTEGKPLDVKTIPAEYAKFNGKSLHYLKLALDDLIKDPQAFGLGSNEVAAISKTRGEFLNWFEGKSTKYAEARAAYKEMSKPINIMQVGQYLEGKLIPALQVPVAERTNVFAGALREAPTTIKRSTGQSRFSQLTDVLEPQQVKVLEGIRDDLAREAEFKLQAREGAKAGKVVPAAELGKSPAFFSKIATLANTIVNKLQGKIDKKVAIELATEMLDPRLAAAALEKAAARQARGERLIGSLTETPMKLGVPKGVIMGTVNALAPENQNNLGAR